MATFNGTNGPDNLPPAFNFLYGGDGNDTLFSVEPGLDVVEGGRGDDFVGVVGPDPSTHGHIYGGDGNDIAGGSENGDELYGGNGNDVIGGGAFSFNSGHPTPDGAS